MKTLSINHWLYGKQRITEPVLLELLASPALERLKDVEQHGTWQLHQSYKASYRFSRYDHSLGVMLLLRLFDASVKEQLHGLLHDISHTVFSHVADFLFGKDPGKHDYQDQRLDKAYKLQGINKILKKHGFDPEFILDEKNFPLAERTLPRLCADRLDYTLQDPWGGVFDTTDPGDLLQNLIVHKNEFAFGHKTWAKKFAHLYEKHNYKNWCNPLQIAIFTLSAAILREALASGVLVKKELYTTDSYVLKKLRASQNPLIKQLLKKITHLRIKVVPTRKQADFWSTSKPRVVDPPFLYQGKLVRLSSVDKAYKKRVDAWAKKVRQGFYLKILNS